MAVTKRDGHYIFLDFRFFKVKIAQQKVFHCLMYKSGVNIFQNSWNSILEELTIFGKEFTIICRNLGGKRQTFPCHVSLFWWLFQDSNASFKTYFLSFVWNFPSFRYITKPVFLEIYRTLINIYKLVQDSHVPIFMGTFLWLENLFSNNSVAFRLSEL